MSVGLLLYGECTANTELAAQGRQLAGIFTSVFVITAVFFEALSFGDLFGTWVFRSALPLLLITAGVFLLLRERGGVSSSE